MAFKKGRTPWNKGKKGLYKLSEETKRKISKANKGQPKYNKDYVTKKCPTCKKYFEKPRWRNAKYCSKKCIVYKENSGSFKKGRIKTKSEIEKVRKKLIGHPMYQDKKRNEKISKSKIGKKRSKEICEKISNGLTGRKLSKEHIKKVLGKQGKSSLEIKFEEMINQLKLPYKFVGNGEVMVARKVPDFVDKNGKKIAIEVYYRKHKEQFRKGLEEWKAERIKIFNKNGWEIIFFDETEVNSANIINKLKEVKKMKIEGKNVC